MLRLFAAAAIAALAATPALAETDWSKYGSFAGTRCEDAGTIADIRESIKTLKFNNGGGNTFARASQVEIAKSVTVKATANMLVCELSMRTLETGGPQFYRARHTVWLYPNGKWRTLYQPNN